MVFKKYEVVHSIPGRIRLIIQDKNNAKGNIEAEFKKVPGIITVRYNPVIQSLLINYDHLLTNEPTIIQNLDKHLSPGISIRDNNLFWSLLAGGTILISYLYRKSSQKNDSSGSFLDYLAAGITAYSVLSHRDKDNGNNCGDKSLHLDDMAGLVSLFSLKTDGRSMGLFITWLLNFIEIMFGWPQYSKQCRMRLGKGF